MWQFLLFLEISCCAVAENNTEQDRATIIEEHTSARGNVTPSASNMQLLRYSRYLETVALQWAAGCINQSANSTPLANHKNISVTWIYHKKRKPRYTEILFLFNNYNRNYFYENNSCIGDCRIYIQYVWANTTEVGCGIRRCNNSHVPAENPRYLVACAYYPAVTVQGLRPYANGSSCSACPDGFFCHRNQCTNDTSLLPNTTTTSTTTGAAINTTTDIGTSTSEATTTTSTLSQVLILGISSYSLFKLLTSP
uniref:SCP domain-containing protein n=1 Tax=Mesocestoides corti TaxID=53468 RepID=A0A5K3ETB6_MESCO